MSRILILFFALLFTIAAYSQNNYFVSTTGDDNNPGTFSQPWRTVQYGADQLSPGDTLNILAGTYNEQVSLSASGTAAQRITIRNYQQDSVILDGAGLTGESMIEIANKSFITLQGLHITNHKINYGIGIYIVGAGEGISLIECQLSEIDFSPDPYPPVNDTTNSSPLLIVGTNPTAPIQNVQIIRCELLNNRTGFSESISLVGNVAGFEISDCLVHDNTNIGIAMIGGYGDCPDSTFDFARQGVVKRNVCSHNNSPYAEAGNIYVDGARDIIIENNVCYEGQYGIEVGAEQPAAIARNITVRNNLIYNNSSAGLACGGYDFPNTGMVVNCTFTGNTLYHNNTGNSLAEIYISYTRGCRFHSNIFFAGSNEMMYHDAFNSPAPPQLDYNTWWSLSGDPTQAVFSYNNNDTYTGFENYRSATGQDLHSQFVDPQFVSPTLPDPDLHLQSTSPCRDAGDPTYIPAADEQDMDGENRLNNAVVDCGADEFYSPTGVRTGPKGKTPQSVRLLQNYPNPFNPNTTLRFRITEFGLVELKIYDLLGKEIKTLLNKQLTPGNYEVPWDATNNAGRPVASGVYFYRLTTGKGFVATHKMVLLR